MAEQPKSPTIGARLREGISRNVLVLGFVALFTDISSEMIVPIRAVFITSVLGAPATILGLIEGIAESTASLLKIVSGRLADRASSRKPLILFGYSMSNLIKPLIGLVSGWVPALGLIFLDRVGKGIRTSPRDAVIADSTPAEFRGKAFGFHRSLDTVGAALGPLVTAAILALTNNDLRQVFFWTLIPGIIGVAIIVRYLREPARATAVVVVTTTVKPQAPPLGRRYWLFLAVIALFAVGNSSDAFLFLRAEQLVGSVTAVSLIYFAYNIVYAALATPLGSLSDRLGRIPVLMVGLLAFILVYFGWAVAAEGWQALSLFLFYGIYAAATEGVGKAMVTDIVAKEQRGTALGWYNGVIGFAALPANLVGGWLWQSYGPGATFSFGAGAAGIAAVLLVGWYMVYRWQK